jgi:lysophospholipase L1-like esterase
VRRLSRAKLATFSLLPALAMLAALELAFRLLSLADPKLTSLPLPEETFGIVVPDGDLFWRLAPGLVLDYGGERGGCRTNAQGLRSGPLGLKAAGEFRILALGESTTFGVGVPDRMAYPQRLEGLLRESGCPGCRVINAGVSAWSSFQSRRFLEKEGLALEPDLVLVYHEINDAMPASFRGSGQSEAAMLRTDAQLHASLQGSMARRVVGSSAFLRWLTFQRARRQIASLRGKPGTLDPASIGLPQIGLRPLVVRTGDERRARVNEDALPPRVLPEERRRIFGEMRELCRRRGIGFAVIHPSYRESMPHRCVLTAWCAAAGVSLLEAHPVLHPAGVPTEAMYLDKMHPTARGHEALAQALLAFVRERFLSLPKGSRPTAGGAPSRRRPGRARRGARGRRWDGRRRTRLRPAGGRRRR